MRHKDIIVRMAKDDDGPAVKELFERRGTMQFDNWELDWSHLEPHWLVAEHEGKIIGTIQVTPAKPFGRIECLGVDPDLPHLAKGFVVKKLTSAGIAANWVYGAQAVASSIPYELEGYFSGAKNRGWVELDQGWIIMRRLV